MNLLEQLAAREDLLRLSDGELRELCQQIRDFLVEHISQTGGHLASNLGIVELTIAIHKVFDTSQDRLVFDVGHQAYVHKILTGRRDCFGGLRTYGGIAGFPKPSESTCDAFIAGHASNSVSVALGMARARSLQKADYSVLALLGDGAMTGGLAFEGLNNAGASREPLIVILNDNGMSISPNVGGISKHLKLIRTKPGYFGIKMAYRKFTKAVPGGKLLYGVTHRMKNFLKKHLVGITLFEEMGFSYIGPVDGSDIGRLTELLQYARELQSPVLLHVITTKGSGYKPAEQRPDRYHGVSSFDLSEGLPQTAGPVSFSQTFGKTLQELATADSRICAVTAAMQPGTGLDPFARQFPTRIFDVGIAEGHAVAMAAGLAKQGMIPVVAIYSTFLQRSYDMLLHDVGLLQLHVVFAVDRAGLVGEDGETHHGVFDVSYLRDIPGMQVLCPANQAELREMMRRAVLELSGPVAIRYPRGGDGFIQSACEQPVIREGRHITLATYGTMINAMAQAASLLHQKGIEAEVVKLSSIKPLELEPVLTSVRKTGRLFVAEETVDAGCVAKDLFAALGDHGIGAVCRHHNLGDNFVTHGSLDTLRQVCGIDADSLCARILEEFEFEA